jgi:PIN domain nuclease of toxin-antitoxin system
MELLLDTHIWIRWLSSDQPLPEEIVRQIEEADQLAVSAVSCWEVAYLAKKGRIQLPLSISSWMQLATKGSDVEVISISSEIAVSSAGLPDIHRDPADRFIIATALICGVKLITFDEQIRCYDCVKDLLLTEST